MGLKKLIFGEPGMQYRIRVFDNGHFIRSALVKDRGQRRIDLIVKPKDLGFLGEETKLSFMINPEIPPRYFGNIQEIDYDIRDSTQLADIFDLCPELVEEINENLYKTIRTLTQKDDHIVLEATFTEKTETEGKEKEIDPRIEVLTDPVPDPVHVQKRELSESEKKIEKLPGVKGATKALSTIATFPHTVKTSFRGIRLLNQIRYAEDTEKQDLMKKVLNFCQEPGNAKCLRWLPKHLNIEPEIMAIVSQTELDGIGVMPMYYIKQSSAEIAEKMLQRPKTPEDWKTTALYIIGILGVLVIFAVIIYFLVKR